jgi:hypothetical protein
VKQKMPLNPWLVDNIEAFSFYCCPECVFRSKEENFFQVHALQNHGLAKSFFLDPEKNGTESNQTTFYSDKTNQVQVKKEVFEKHEGNIIPKVKLEIDDNLEWNSSWQFKDPLFKPVLSQSRKKDSRNQTQEHVERSHTYECDQCGKRCKNDKQLDLHVLQHKSVKLISCPQSECSEEIVQKFLKDHLKNVHNVEIDLATTSWVQGNVKEFQCEDCGRECKDQKHYDNHKYYHKNTLNGPQITCVKCDIQIPEKLFARHIKRVHENQDENGDFQERFANDVKVEVTPEEQNENLTNSQLDNFQDDLDNFQCDERGKYCKDQKHLDHHKQYHKYYLNGEQVTCELCNEILPKKGLKRHKERKHVDKSDKNFPCDQLDKFGNNCKYASYRKDQLADHVKRCHSGKTKTKSIENKVKSEEETSNMEVDQSEATKIDQSEAREIKYKELEGEEGDI